ncbi:MAG: hypothetical protein PHO92_04990 [Candidatus Peribacteraceae bacterium]|nr:hypothetical protein [Candidatus Peribacteraceae bacterium]
MVPSDACTHATGATRIAKRRHAWKNGGVRKLLLLAIAATCFLSLFPSQNATAWGVNLGRPVTYPDAEYSGGGVPAGVEAAGEFGTSTNLRDVLMKVLNAIFLFLGIIAVLVIVIAGIYLMIGGGNDETRQKAYKMILYAIIGLILILLAGAIVRFVANTL